MSLNSFWYPDWLVPLVAWSAAVIFIAVVVGHGVRPKYRRLYGWEALGRSLWHALLPALGVQAYLWLALIVLWTPVWWLAVIAAELADIGTATGWFVTAVVVFYGVWIVRGLTGRSVSQAFAATAERDDAAPDEVKRVAVVGAGMAGLVAAKELKEEGHEVVIFERTAGPGGVWASSKARGGVAWGTTMTSTGALNTTLSDSPTEVFHAENERWPHHFDRQQFLDLLEDYEARHGVFDGSLRCEVEVESMRPLPHDRWRLVVRDTVDGTAFEEDFDAVTICTGLNKESFTPEVAGQEHFVGPQMHVEDYRPEDGVRFSGQRVLVMGLGETSSDVVKDLVDQGAEHVYVSQRGETFVLPREVANLPPDHCETRLVHDGPMFHRFAMLWLGAGPVALFPLLRPSRLRPPTFAHVWRIMVLHHPRKWLLWRFGSMNWTKSDNIYAALDTGRASVRRDVDRLDGQRVVFIDGFEAEIDAVIYATGYRPGTSLLPPIVDDDATSAAGAAPDVPRSARDLYRLTIPPHHPNVAMIGFARGQIGAITLSTEMQARWWALLVSGKRQLPTADTMSASVEQMRRRGRNFHQPTRTTPCFAYSIARHEIGCEPNLFRLFGTDPRLWFAVFMGPICAANFRLRGPQAKPEQAREQLLMPQAIQSDDYIDSVDLFINTLPLATLVLPMYGVYSRLLPGFNMQNATRSYI